MTEVSDTGQKDRLLTLPDSNKADTWTCDHWMLYGVWTTKNYAMTEGVFPVRYVDKRRRCCAAINPSDAAYCRRCGFPSPEREARRELAAL